MSEDQLQRIKKELAEFEWFEYIVDEEDFRWLISEVERFQEKDGLRTREHNILVQENRNLTATIATLRDRLRKAQRSASMECSNCGGYSLALSDGAQKCSCLVGPENTRWYDEKSPRHPRAGGPMTEDRLGEIRRAIEENDGAPWPIVVEDCRWVISEVERLRGEIAARKRHDELNVEPGIVQRDATIATLQAQVEELRPLVQEHIDACGECHDGYGAEESDKDGLCTLCGPSRKALASTPHSAGRRVEKEDYIDGVTPPNMPIPFPGPKGDK